MPTEIKKMFNSFDCGCQGSDAEKSGKAYSFGCGKHLFKNTCKLTPKEVTEESKYYKPNKWKCLDSAPEKVKGEMKAVIESVAATTDNKFKNVLPDTYESMVSGSVLVIIVINLYGLFLLPFVA